MSVMLAQEIIPQPHHLAPSNAKPRFFKALQDIAAMSFRDTIGLQQNKGRFHKIKDPVDFTPILPV